MIQTELENVDSNTQVLSWPGGLVNILGALLMLRAGDSLLHHRFFDPIHGLGSSSPGSPDAVALEPLHPLAF